MASKSRNETMIRWSVFSAIFISLAILAAFYGKRMDFAGFEAPLMVSNLTLAILSINFSFVTHQASEYRQFQRGLSPNLLFGCLCVLLLALLPAFTLVFARSYVGVVGLTMLPITALTSMLLVGIAKREALPIALIKQLCRKWRVKAALRRYGNLVQSKEAEWKGLDLSKPEDMPTHEWRWIPLPVVPASDPFTKLGAIAATAAKAGDISVIVQVARGLLDAMDLCADLIRSAKRSLPSRVSTLVNSQLERVVAVAENADSTGDTSARLLDTFADYLATRSKERWPPVQPCNFIAGLMVESGERWLAKNRADVARRALIVLRLLCQQGIYRWEGKEVADEDMDSLFWIHNLGWLADMMKPLGTAAIAAAETDFLYRVFDAYGWLGCSAVKARNREVTRACVRALAQLGREARAKGLECFWDRCAVRPEDHARERIEWILTWTAKIDDDARADWIAIIEQGLSRIAGRGVSITYVNTTGKPSFDRNISAAPYVERFGSDAGWRELDYSDPKMLKDFELYGHTGGMMMRGPAVPLQFSTAPNESD